MNHGILLLLLAAVTNMQDNNTYGRRNIKEGAVRPLRIDTSSLRSIKPQHMIGQMQNAIDVLQRVEQIGELVDFSGTRAGRKDVFRDKDVIKNKDLLSTSERLLEDNQENQSGSLRESFSNVRDYLGKAAEREESSKPNSSLNLGDMAGLAGLLSGGNGGLDVEKIMKMVSLMSSLNKK